MKILKWIIFPFTLIYILVVSIRNFMFDIGFFKQEQFPVRIISVGNLSTGGTGKTPFVEYLINSIPSTIKIAVLSRGYKRNTKGYVRADERSTASSIGDEPFQLYKKYGQRLVVAVAEKRRIGVYRLMSDKNPPDLILLDDAFQHRWVKRDLNILLTTYAKPFFNDFTLPTGNLREPRVEAKRADVVVVTKCPDVTDEKKTIFEKKIKRLAGDVMIDFARIRYEEVRSAFGNKTLEAEQVVLLSGIANPTPFNDYMAENYQIIERFTYPDHYAFTRTDLNELNVKLSQNDYPIITTEKDMVRLLAHRDHPVFDRHSLFYLPISFSLDKSEELTEQIMKGLR